MEQTEFLENPIVARFLSEQKDRMQKARELFPNVTTAELDQSCARVMADLKSAGVAVEDPETIRQLIAFMAALHLALHVSYMQGRDERVALLLNLGALTLSLMNRAKLLQVVE